jgi:PAS domain S-box-containing protein
MNYSTRVTVFALAAPTAALLASHSGLASLGHPLTIGGSAAGPVVTVGVLVIGAVWAGATMWTAGARKRRQEYRASLHELLRRFDAAIILTDARGSITAMNDAAASTTGWPETEAIGLPVGAAFQLVDQQTHQRVVNPVVKALYKGIVVEAAPDAVLLSKTGEERQIRETALPLRNDHGHVVGCALVWRDLGESVPLGRRIEIR